VTPLRVAAAQASSLSGDVAANVATAVSLVTAAADQGARVVVLPELFLTGYDPAAWTHEASLALDDPLLDPLRDVAGERSVVTVAGAAVRRALDASTLSVLVLADGEVTVPYDKQHLCDEERVFFTAGDHGATLEVDGWRLGLGVCYDACFPEHARAAAVDGAHAYLCSSAYFVGAEHRRDVYHPARALDNGVYVVLSGLSGSCGQSTFSGGSAVYDPEGQPLGRVGDESPAVLVADLDPDVLVRVRARHPMLADRVADLGGRTLLRVPRSR
jgi:predicted amidohydrolase